MRKTLFAALLSSLTFTGVAIGCDGCGDDAAEDADSGPTEEPRHGLTAEQASQVLVKIGDEVITVGEFADRLADQSPYLRARYNSPERRREYLDNMVRFELMALEAERRGLHELPEVERTRKQVMIQQMMKEQFEDRVQLSDVTDDEIRAYYEANAEEFNKPEQVRASHIMFPKSQRAKAQQVLRQVLQKEDDVNFFRQMAEEHNTHEPTRDRFGDLRFFSRPGEGEDAESVPDPVAEAAFGIEQIGKVHPQLVETEEGLHIVKLTGRRAALSRSLEEARRPIQNKLWREKREKSIDDFLARLREEANVEENFDELEHVRIDLPEGDSPTAEVPEGGSPGSGAAPAGGAGGGQAGGGAETPDGE